MDLLLRNRSPQNAYDAKVLRDRRVEDRRADLAKHQREEDLLRLNNSWYSKQADQQRSPASAHSTASHNQRPYGIMSDIKVNSPQKRRSASQSPTMYSSAPANQQQQGRRLPSSSSPAHQGNEYGYDDDDAYEDAGEEAAAGRYAARSFPPSSQQHFSSTSSAPALSSSNSPLHATMPSAAAATGPVFPPSMESHRSPVGLSAPYSSAQAAMYNLSEGARSVGRSSPPPSSSRSRLQAQEYAISSSQVPLPRTKLRKNREFSGVQVASLLGAPSGSLTNGSHPPSSARNNSNNYYAAAIGSDLSPEAVANDLLEQMRRRDAEEKKLRKLEMQLELEHVRSTLTEARAQFDQEDDSRYAKQKEALRLLQESERSSFEAQHRKKQLEMSEENLARLESEAMEAKRAREVARRKAMVEDKLARVSAAAANQAFRVMENIPAASPLHEAVKRLLEAHANELDVIAPLVQEILDEAEFSMSPWL